MTMIKGLSLLLLFLALFTILFLCFYNKESKGQYPGTTWVEHPGGTIGFGSSLYRDCDDYELATVWSTGRGWHQIGDPEHSYKSREQAKRAVELHTRDKINCPLEDSSPQATK